MKDVVNHPEHYQTSKGLETIDVIEAFTEDLTGMEAVCTANALKYICRWKKKNGVQDLKKAKWYLEKLIEKLDNDGITLVPNGVVVRKNGREFVIRDGEEVRFMDEHPSDVYYVTSVIEKRKKRERNEKGSK